LAEARQLAEEALVIKQTLDPAAAEIWKTYELLAEIADQEAALTADSRRKAKLQTQAMDHRRRAREAKRKFAGTRHELRRHLPLILATVLATQDAAEQGKLDDILKRLTDLGWSKLVGAVRRIIGGERDSIVLEEELDLEDSMIVETILVALSDPSTLKDLLPADDEATVDQEPS
jgi:hypothetical protein